jgi:hypothetical protein
MEILSPSHNGSLSFLQNVAAYSQGISAYPGRSLKFFRSVYVSFISLHQELSPSGKIGPPCNLCKDEEDLC